MNGFLNNASPKKATNCMALFLMTMLSASHVNAATESSVMVGGQEVKLKSFLSSVKTFDRNQKDLWAVEIDPQFMAAFDAESNAVSEQKSPSTHHQDAAKVYGAATAYTSIIGRGLSGSGLAHFGLNLLLGSAEANVRKYQIEQMRRIRSEQVLIGKIIDTETPEQAFYKAIEELNPYLSAMCPVEASANSPAYMKERYIWLPIQCKAREYSVYLDIRHVKFFPALVEQGAKGFRVRLSVLNGAWKEGSEFGSREQYIDMMKELVPSDWYIQYSDSSAETYVVRRNSKEIRFPLPKMDK